MNNYFYPVLSPYDFGWFRVSGPGLANCLLTAARAYVRSRLENAEYIDPTWTKFSPGTFLRGEKDKRIYCGLFRPAGISGWKKACILLKYNVLPPPFRAGGRVVRVEGLGDYFSELNGHMDIIQEFIGKITKEKTVCAVPAEKLRDCIAVHVRLGDYVPRLRVPVGWYAGILRGIRSLRPEQKFAVFSDGTDEELKELLRLPRTKRVFYGNAYADMYAMSHCRMVVASDSTFSAWGAFMGRRPVLFSKRHFPRIYRGEVPEAVLGGSVVIPEDFQAVIAS